MERLRRTALLALVLALPATYALRPVEDNDVFFHIRTGSWIAEHHAVPRTDPFTVFGEGKPYVAYAWLFQLGLSSVHHALGFLGVAAFEAVLVGACALAAWRLVARRGAGFTKSAALAALALVAILRMVGPRSWLFTIIFFTLELDLVLSVRERGDEKRLFWLVPLFALWANLHIQFVYGLAVMFICALERVRERRPVSTLVAAGLACALATLANPYGLGVWETVLEYARAKSAYVLVSEHAPPDFRSAFDWVLVGLAVGAAAALVKARERRVFPWLLLALGAVLGFRSRRDGFVLAAIAAALLAAALAPREAASGEDFPATRRGWLAVLATSAVFLVLVAWGRGLSEEGLRAGIAKTFPARACDELLARGLPGPVFNDYDWGSYLIFRLEGRLVAIDGRTNLHGDARIERSRAVWNGAAGWEQDEDLVRSRSIVAPSEKPLTALLKKDPRFALVHEDEVACVFSRTTP